MAKERERSGENLTVCQLVHFRFQFKKHNRAAKMANSANNLKKHEKVNIQSMNKLNFWGSE